MLDATISKVLGDEAFSCVPCQRGSTLTRCGWSLENNEPKATWTKGDTTWMVNRHRHHPDIDWTSSVLKIEIEGHKGLVVIMLCILYIASTRICSDHFAMYHITLHVLSNYTVDSHACMVYPVYKFITAWQYLEYHETDIRLVLSKKNHYENQPKLSWKKPQMSNDGTAKELIFGKHNQQRRLHWQGPEGWVSW